MLQYVLKLTSKTLFLNTLFTIGNGSSPSIRRRILFTTSLISKLGILQDQPVPIPSAPFISTIGMIGIYHSGSTRWLSSYRNLRILSSIGGNSNRASGLERKREFKPKFLLQNSDHHVKRSPQKTNKTCKSGLFLSASLSHTAWVPMLGN